jgi:hypothetical protein
MTTEHPHHVGRADLHVLPGGLGPAGFGFEGDDGVGAAGDVGVGRVGG